jgi:plasmid maintenance system killer protein
MIKNFADKNTERIFHSEFVKTFSKEVQIVARRKLWSIDIAARTVEIVDYH